jgi:hypothetical protein
MKNIKVIAGRIFNDIKEYKIAIIAFGIYNIVIRLVFHAVCPQLIITGFPCAGCGMTRAVYCLITLQFKRAMRLNPAAPIWVAFIICFMWNRYVLGVYKKSTLLFMKIICVITLGIYIYRMLKYFPGAPPMSYYRNNLLGKFFSELKNIR